MQHKRRTFGVVALVVALAATAAACGDNDDDTNAVKTEAAAADVAGSDQHLTNTAAELARQERVNAAATARLAGEAERQAHLAGQANTYGDEHREPGIDAGVNAQEAGNRAAAEAAERQAHLAGQANTYGD